MKLGIDVRNLTRPLTGIGRYTFEFCKRLVQDKDFECYFYAPSPLLNFVEDDLKAGIIKSSNIHSKMGRHLWGETILPLEVYKDNIDVFWGPAHRIPLMLPSSIKSVVTIHDLVWKYYPDTMQRSTRLLDQYLMPPSIKKANTVFSVSHATKKSLIESLNVKAEKIEVIYPGINSIKDSPSKLENFPPTYILFVGTLEPRKNLKRLLAAYAKLDKSLRSDYPLVIAGGKGWGDVQMKAIINDYQLHDDCHLLGYVDDDKLASLYAYCSFLAMPSLYEGFGLPIAEVSCYGKMSLIGNTSSMPEIAGEYGYPVDPFSIDSIYNGLIYLIKYREQKDINMSFSWNESIKQIKSSLATLIK